MFLWCLWCLSTYKSFNFNITKYISLFLFCLCSLYILKFFSMLRLICCFIFLNKILKICFSDWDLYSSCNLFLCMMWNKNLTLFSIWIFKSIIPSNDLPVIPTLSSFYTTMLSICKFSINSICPFVCYFLLINFFELTVQLYTWWFLTFYYLLFTFCLWLLSPKVFTFTVMKYFMHPKKSWVLKHSNNCLWICYPPSFILFPLRGNH